PSRARGCYPVRLRTIDSPRAQVDNGGPIPSSTGPFGVGEKRLPMDISAICPACHETLQDGTAATMPSVCPNCGVRVTCPGCGSRLERRSNDTDTLFCLRCGVAAREGST